VGKIRLRDSAVASAASLTGVTKQPHSQNQSQLAQHQYYILIQSLMPAFIARLVHLLVMSAYRAWYSGISSPTARKLVNCGRASDSYVQTGQNQLVKGTGEMVSTNLVLGTYQNSGQPQRLPTLYRWLNDPWMDNVCGKHTLCQVKLSARGLC
jgi:hypothetical protein